MCRQLLAIGVICLMVGGIARSDDLPPDPEQAANRQAGAERLKLMRRRVMSLTAQVKSAKGWVKAELIESPLLRYSNPAGQIVTPDAAVWAWSQEGRPIALTSVEESGCEVVSLADTAVSLTGKSGLKWSPKSSELEWKIVPGAPAPVDGEVARARQMKEIAQGFTATGHYGKGTENLDLRLLVRHLHRYSNPEQKLIDGAIFAFVAGTNPEVLLLVECRESAGKRRDWFYAFARLSAGELDARHGDKLVWNCPAIDQWVADAPYSVAKFGRDDLAPDDLPPSK
jgi:hypothetical protein